MFNKEERNNHQFLRNTHDRLRKILEKVGSQSEALHHQEENIFSINLSQDIILLAGYALVLVCSQVEYRGIFTFILVKALFQSDLYSHYRLLPFLCKFAIKYSKQVMTNNSGNYCQQTKSQSQQLRRLTSEFHAHIQTCTRTIYTGTFPCYQIS